MTVVPVWIVSFMVLALLDLREYEPSDFPGFHEWHIVHKPAFVINDVVCRSCI